MFERNARQPTRLGPLSLLFTNILDIGVDFVGRKDTTPISHSMLDAMRLQYEDVGGGLVAEVEASFGDAKYAILVMKNFLDRIAGAGSLSSLQLELAAVSVGREDKPLLFADFEDHSASTHSVFALHKHPTIQQARNMASVWTMQDHPLIGQTGPLIHEHVEGRCVHWHICLRECTLESHQGTVELEAGDVFVMSLVRA